VLPLPVGDLASTSRPASMSAITSDWMGNGAVMPRSVRAPTTGRDTPRSAKDCVDIGTPEGERRYRAAVVREANGVPEPPNWGGTQACTLPRGPHGDEPSS